MPVIFIVPKETIIAPKKYLATVWYSCGFLNTEIALRKIDFEWDIFEACTKQISNKSINSGRCAPIPARILSLWVMTHEMGLLFEFLNGFPELKGEPLDELAACIPVKQFPKGYMLQREGVVPRACYFVLEGLVREYRIADGKEYTIEFYDEQYGAISSRHFVEQTPVDSFVECLEDSVLIVGSNDMSVENFERFPVLKSITASMVQADLNERRERFSDFIISNPQKRYEDLLAKRPELLQRASLNQMASYLGFTPETLSRIRNRVSRSAR